jgi:hypothetical protein
MFRTDFTRQNSSIPAAGRAALRLVSGLRSAERQASERQPCGKQPCERDMASGQFSFGFAEPLARPLDMARSLDMARPRSGRPRPTLVVTDTPARQLQQDGRKAEHGAAPEPSGARARAGSIPGLSSGLASGARAGEIPLRSRADGVDPRFTAWRGQSGRRYVATAYALASDEAFSFEDAVLIAVAADRSVLAVRDSGPFEHLEDLQGWRSEVAEAGAVEIHVHLIAATPEERRRAVADLDPGQRSQH